MNLKRLGRLTKPLRDPRSLARISKRLVLIGAETHKHTVTIPEDATDAERRLQSQLWGQRLCDVIGLNIHVIKEEEPPEGAKLVVANHRSYADILVLLALLPCRFLAKKEVLDWYFVGKGAKAVNTLCVDRDAETSRLKSREAIEEGLLGGSSIAIFPEGTTRHPPGCHKFYPGSFKVAAKVGAPVVPMAIEYGPQAAWEDDETAIEHFIRNFSVKNADVYVRIGKAIYPDDISSPDNKEEVDTVGMKLLEESFTWIDNNLREMWVELTESHPSEETKAP